VAGWLLVGCSSSSAPPSDATARDGSAATGGDAGSCSDSPAVWKEDGTTRCGTSGDAILSTTTVTTPYDGGPIIETSLEVAILQPTTAYDFSFVVTSSTGVGGTYECAGSPTSVAQFTYDEVGVFSTSTTSCSLSVTLTPIDGGAPDGGMVATGTFSAVLAVIDGGTKTISDGTFAFPVTTGH
jgi:hypothetical protein